MNRTAQRALGRSLVALLLVALCACAGPQRSDDARYGESADSAYQVGREYQAAGNLDEAARAYAVSIERNERFVMARYNLAVIQMEQGEPSTARDNLDRVVSLDPSLIGAQVLLAELNLALNDPARALESADKALESEPSNTDALILRANALGKLGRDAEALATYERLVNLGTEYKEASMRIALLLIKAGKVKEGTDRLRSLAASYPQDVELQIALGRAWFTGRQYDNAIEVLRRVVQTDDNRPTAHLLLGRSYLQRGQEPLALISLQKAERGLPNDPEVFVALGEVELRRGYTERAEESVKRALALDPRSLDALLLQAAIARRLKDNGGVEEALEQVLQIDPRHVEAAEQLARHHRDNKRFDVALKLLQPFATTPDATVELRLLAADLAEEAQQPAQAVAILRAAVEAGAPEEVLLRLVRLTVAQPDLAGQPPAEVVAWADRLHESALGGTADTLLLLVDALVANKEADRAKEILKVASRTFKGDARIREKQRALK